LPRDRPESHTIREYGESAEIDAEAFPCDIKKMKYKQGHSEQDKLAVKLGEDLQINLGDDERGCGGGRRSSHEAKRLCLFMMFGICLVADKSSDIGWQVSGSLSRMSSQSSSLFLLFTVPSLPYVNSKPKLR